MYSGRILEEGNTCEVFSSPAHEYTRGLLNSVPSAAMRGKALAAIPGKIPSLEEGRPSGCPFHPRCEKAMPECRKDFPPEKKIGANRATRCILGGIDD
jgi:oligopeptide/dipeptide ABC transporter ATP-binding protein